MADLQFVHAGIGSQAVPYELAWEQQRRVHAAVVAGERPDTCLLLEHPPVYTAGRRTEASERPVDGTPVIDVDRGGKITWHGPGQLVGYPIVRLTEPVDVVAHVRRLEEALIRTCAELGLETTRVEGRSGVWVLGDALPPAGAAPASGGAGLSLRLDSRISAPDPRAHPEFDPRLAGPEYAPSNAGQRGEDRKLAAIGIRVSRKVTMHGFALNCDPDTTSYDRIVPCGIRDAGVSSLSRELGRRITVADVMPLVERHLAEVFAPIGV
ncbi:lipoyl(octanoyl) transferase LipB [Yinghuangia sp. ASG 101]|uniref:lipoyl(octanoyl) transferase LipB n=1 Tax=Yinghuangia sp. ASG 101 TaxID=2896848 RepID=UPI001E523C32|nr:lipoyl(octanoyl) transferase LipB [Yinghuangia sp. ASG 101]UGQ09953.1 lipoyl(octanoyl) transferase LipB [Yinghuangia sp. ASG 101]